MATVDLDAATPAELSLLKAYLRSLRAEDPMPAGTLADDATAIAALQALMADASLGRAWLIHAHGQPVGYAVLTFVHSIEFGGRCGFVDELYVDPLARGKGVGRQAIDLVAEQAKSLGVRILLLEVSPENESAIRLYERVGFSHRKYRMMARSLR